MFKKLGLSSLLLLLPASVTFAQSFAEGSVSVTLPSNGSITPSAAASQVLSALQVADSVLGPAGFVRGPMSPRSANGSGFIGAFKRDVSVGSPTQCNVFLQNNRVIFSLVESGIPSPTAAQLSDALAKALRNQFGAAAVAVQLK